MTISANDNVSPSTPQAILAAYIFGLGGLIPFIGLTAGILTGFWITPVLAASLQVYSAVILSFLGGIRWGFATAAQPGRAAWWEFAISVVPALAAWGAMFLSLPLSYAILAGAIGAWFLFEIAVPAPAATPAWYIRLRTILTAGAVLSLLTAYWFWG